MAEWSKNKVEPIEINGGQEFVKGDNLAVDELNTIVNNSFYASDKSERAEQLAESAVKGNGTLVTIGGQIQGEWSADFAESERQKSKNLSYFRTIDNTPETYTASVDNQVVTISGTGSELASVRVGIKPVVLKAYKTYTFTVFASEEMTGSVYISTTDSGFIKHGVFENTLTHVDILTWLTNKDTEVDALVFEFKNCPFTNMTMTLQIEEGTIATDYQPYNGAIVHENNDAVQFAESERQKSKNLCCLLTLNESNGGITVDYDGTNQIVTINGSGGNADYMVNRNISPVLKNNAGKVFTVTFEYISGTISNDTNGEYLHSYIGSLDTRIWDNQINLATMLYDLPTVGKMSKTITLINDETYDTLRYYIKGHTVANNFKFRVQIEEGDNATDYQPYNGQIVHEKEFVYKAMTKIGGVYLSDESYTSIDISNIDFKAGASYLIEFRGGVSSPNDGKVLINNRESGYSILTEIAYYGETSVGVDENETHIPIRYDKYFDFKLYISMVSHYTGSATFLSTNSYSAPTSNANAGKYTRNSQGIVGVMPVTSIKFQSDSSFLRGTRVNVYKYGE